MLTIGTVWRRARLTLGLTEQELADVLGISANDLAVIEAGRMPSLTVTDRFTQFSGVDLYVLYRLSEPTADIAPLAAPLAEALKSRLRALGAENRRPADWTEVRRQVSAMPGGRPRK